MIDINEAIENMCLPCVPVQAAVKTAVKIGRVSGSTSSAEQLTETPSPRAAFLESFPSLNPFTAARLAALPCSMQQLLCSSPEDRQKLIQMVPDIPQHSLELFFKQASWGAPVQQGEPKTAVLFSGLSCQYTCQIPSCVLSFVIPWQHFQLITTKKIKEHQGM